ncbi:MAG: replicative DNA helicase [Solobacterium sp.]|nr:replicative DNA helicase [Solobacterium sp.]
MAVRAMPSALEAEASLLGTMMVYGSAARTAVEEGLSEEDFYSDANRRIYRAMVSLYREGVPVDLATTSTRLKDTNDLDSVGGFAYLTTLTDAAVTSANTKSYVMMIHDKAVIRNMITAAEKIASDGLEGQPEVNDYLDEAEKAVLNISRNRRTTMFRETPELMNEVMDSIRRMSDNHSDITGIKTGFRDLDRLTHGFQKGDLIILAARPSMGKTAVALNLAMNIAAYQPQQAVAIFSLEMGAEQLAMRLLSARSRVEGDKLKTGRLAGNDEWNRVNEACATLKSSKIFIDDTPGLKTSEIFSKCRRLQADQGLSMVMIDYIQLITGSSSSKDASRQQEVSDISRNLKALARELQVPVIALSQLSRLVESRENKHPQLSDLRESGAIEQDADIVMLLYRDAYYNDEAKQLSEQTGSEELEINIAKHRNGATKRINLVFEPATNALMNLDRHAEN